MAQSTWKKTLSYASETFYPGISLYEKGEAQTEIIASLPLQMSLYFNVIFFPVWCITTIVITNAKFACLTTLYKFIIVTVLAAATVIEVLRMYLGYIGNLAEKIPEVAGFWMLSFLLALPLQIYLISSQHLRLSPLEYTVQGIMFILLVIQLTTGFFALRQAAHHQATKFHLQMQEPGRDNLGFQENEENVNK